MNCHYVCKWNPTHTNSILVVNTQTYTEPRLVRVLRQGSFASDYYSFPESEQDILTLIFSSGGNTHEVSQSSQFPQYPGHRSAAADPGVSAAFWSMGANFPRRHQWLHNRSIGCCRSR